MKAAWAYGTDATFITHNGAVGTDCGYVTVNLVAGGGGQGPTFPQLMMMPFIFFALAFAAVIGTLAVLHNVHAISRLPIMRTMMYGRFVCFPKVPELYDNLTWGTLSFFNVMTFGEILAFVMYLVGLAAFTLSGLMVYGTAGRDPYYILGYLSSLHIALVILPINRNSPFLYLCGIPFERALNMHRVVGRFTFVFIAGHFVHAYLKFKAGATGSLLQNQGTDENLTKTSGNLDGTISGLIFLFLIAASWNPIRRKFFEWFYYIHQTFFIGLYFAFSHSRVSKLIS
jgi:hypothetical protein